MTEVVTSVVSPQRPSYPIQMPFLGWKHAPESVFCCRATTRVSALRASRRIRGLEPRPLRYVRTFKVQRLPTEIEISERRFVHDNCLHRSLGDFAFVYSILYQFRAFDFAAIFPIVDSFTLKLTNHFNRHLDTKMKKKKLMQIQIIFRYTLNEEKNRMKTNFRTDIGVARNKKLFNTKIIYI